MKEKTGRTLCVGDLHGALRALEQVLDRAKVNPNVDKLIFLGDYVDGYSQSAEVIEFLIDLDTKSINKPIFIRGNHDIWCQDWLHTGHKPYIWTYNGGQTTLDSYLRTGLNLEQSHRNFFKNLVNWYIDDENRLFIHAGWAFKEGNFPEAALLPMNAQSITPSMECHWDRSIINHCMANKQKPKALEQFKEVYVGHTTTRYWKCKAHYPEAKDPNQKTNNGPIDVPINRFNLWDLDTGCGWSGKLTIMDVNSKEYWQSDYSKELYPEEKGR